MKKLIRKTKRLTIRCLEPKDYHAWKAAHTGASAARNDWDLGPRDEAGVTRKIFSKRLAELRKMRADDKFYDMSVFDKDGNLVGAVALMEVARGISHTAFLGYRIFNNHWRKGYGKEAVRAAIDIGFKDIKLHRIEAGIEPGNIRSIRLARSLKMRREGTKKRAIFLKNRWVDLVMYTLTTEDVGLKFNTSKLFHVRRT